MRVIVIPHVKLLRCTFIGICGAERGPLFLFSFSFVVVFLIRNIFRINDEYEK